MQQHDLIKPREPSSVPDHAGLQLLMAASSVCDLREQTKQSQDPLELQGHQGI